MASVALLYLGSFPITVVYILDEGVQSVLVFGYIRVIRFHNMVFEKIVLLKAINSDNYSIDQVHEYIKGKEFDIVDYSEDAILSNPNSFFILMSNDERVFDQIKSLEKLGLIFKKNYSTVWEKAANLAGSLYSFEKLFRSIKDTVLDICDCINVISDGKLVSAIYGNCQIQVLSKMIVKSKEYRDNYIMLQYPEVFKVSVYNECMIFFEKSLSTVDLLLYQHVSDSNRFSKELSTDYVKKLIKTDSKTVCFPNSYVGVYYPQLTKVRGEIIPGDLILPYGDQKIQQYSIINSFDSITSVLESPSLYSSEFIESYKVKCFEELHSREKYCDVIISDYIEENYKKRCIGYSPNHPKNEVFLVVTKRILSFLGYSSEDVNSIGVSDIDRHEMIIYPSVQQHLQLEFKKDNFVINKVITPKPISINEYVRYYTYLTNPTKFYKMKDCKLNYSPAVSFTKNIILLQNKVLVSDGNVAHFSLYFKKNNDEDAAINLSRKCLPAHKFTTICHSNLGSFPVIVTDSGTIVLKQSCMDWALIDMTYLCNIE